jgi:hypothetical protein
MRRIHGYFFVFLWGTSAVHAMLEEKDDLIPERIVEAAAFLPLSQLESNPEGNEIRDFPRHQPRSPSRGICAPITSPSQRGPIFSLEGSEFPPQKDPIPEGLTWLVDFLVHRYADQRTFATIENNLLINIFENSRSDSSDIVDYLSRCFDETQSMLLGTIALSAMVLYPTATRALLVSGRMGSHIERFSLCGGWWTFFWFKSEIAASGYSKESILFFAYILNQRFHGNQERTINFLDKADYLWEHSGDELRILACPPKKDPLELIWNVE